MSKKGKWTNEVNTTKNIIKNNEFITKDGEIIELHDSVLENIAMDIVNYKEDEEQKKEILNNVLLRKKDLKKK